MYAARKWSVSRARLLVAAYNKLEGVLTGLDALWLKIGYDRVEKPITFIKNTVRSVLETVRDNAACGPCRATLTSSRVTN